MRGHGICPGGAPTQSLDLFPFICGQDSHEFVPFDALAIIGTISQRRVAMEVAGLAIMDEAQRRT